MTSDIFDRVHYALMGTILAPLLAHYPDTTVQTRRPSAEAYDQFGVATYYHNPNHGGLIAAHLTLPFGTHVRVHNLDNGRDVVVTIVDRGPYASTGRIIDLSTVAADVLDMRQAGVARVRLELVQ